MMFRILFVFSLLICLCYANNIVFDYCVGDTSLPAGPTGYACKDPTKVTVDDFVYSGLRGPVNNANLFGFGISTAFASQFPGLNGMGISLARADMDVGVSIPIHAHRVSELIIVVEGTIIVGFIDTNNTAFYKRLHKGDAMIIPPTLQHFAANVGTTPSSLYAAYSSQNPGIQIVSNALFQSALPSEIIEKVTLLDHAQVKKLKKIFGGSN